MASDPTTRLRWHAGLMDAGCDASRLVDVLALECVSADSFERAIDDVVEMLSLLNHELNGPVPSTVVGDASDIPRTVAYAVAEIRRLLRESPRENAAVTEATWSVDTAWSAILAGDTDDIRQHLAEERMTRE